MAGKPFTSRFSELEERFLELEPRIPQGPEKEAIALLHAMIQEAPRRLRIPTQSVRSFRLNPNGVPTFSNTPVRRLR